MITNSMEWLEKNSKKVARKNPTHAGLLPLGCRVRDDLRDALREGRALCCEGRKCERGDEGLKVRRCREHVVLFYSLVACK